MQERGETTSVFCVRFERLLPGPIDKVWAHLTETRLLPAWFGEDSGIEPGPGGRVRLMGGHIRGLVTQWHPPRKLVYTWNVFDPGDPEDAMSAYPESYPTFELTPRGSEVAVEFLHLPIPEAFLPQTAMGWHTMLDILEAGLRGRAIAERSHYMTRNAELYGVDLSRLQT